MKAHTVNTLAVANSFENHAEVTLVIYPEIECRPKYELTRRQMKNFSGMIGFQVKNE
jgi:cystathionine beta-lyase/cystathionine gamma-synthase